MWQICVMRKAESPESPNPSVSKRPYSRSLRWFPPTSQWSWGLWSRDQEQWHVKVVDSGWNEVTGVAGDEKKQDQGYGVRIGLKCLHKA